jgi:phosphate starvation-inducible PhoH-like protein
MARKRRTIDDNQVNIDGLTRRQTKRRKPINYDVLLEIDPLTLNQEKLFKFYDEGKNIFAHGVPGSGKTYCLLYKALKEVLDEKTPYEKIYIVRSLVQTREIGFMPGGEDDKKSLFEIPYKNMVKHMFMMPDDAAFEMLYGNLKAQGTISFWCTSFIRGVTLDRAIIIVDEAQNCSAHECFSVISRCGLDTKIMFSGDIEQSDLIKQSERNGILDFIRIINEMPSFEKLEFGIDDIVRSPLVKEFVIAKKSLGL